MYEIQIAFPFLFLSFPYLFSSVALSSEIRYYELMPMTKRKMVTLVGPVQ